MSENLFDEGVKPSTYDTIGKNLKDLEENNSELIKYLELV